MEHATPPVTTRHVSVAEAARELGISPETVRRRIKAGEIEARRAIRPQGTVWEVSLPLITPRGVPPVAPVAGPGEASLSKPEHATPAEASHPSPRLPGHTSDTAPLVASIARLIVELAEVRTISDRRADQLVSQAQALGRMTAERDAARRELEILKALIGSHSSLAGQETPDAPPALATDVPVPLPARLSYLAPWALLVTALGVVAFALALSR
jgi:hypothetical protein